MSRPESPQESGRRDGAEDRVRVTVASPAMIHILHVLETTGPGGAETVCLELGAGLDPTRFRSTSAVTGPGWAFDTFQARGLSPAIVPNRKGSVDLRFLAGLARLIRRRNVQLIQSH